MKSKDGGGGGGKPQRKDHRKYIQFFCYTFVLGCWVVLYIIYYSIYVMHVFIRKMEI